MHPGAQEMTIEHTTSVQQVHIQQLDSDNPPRTKIQNRAFQLWRKWEKNSSIILSYVITRLVVAPMRWIQDGWQREYATIEVNQDSLDSQMDGCHANPGNLHLMLYQSKTTMGETLTYSRRERSNIDTRSNQWKMKYVRCKVK